VPHKISLGLFLFPIVPMWRYPFPSSPLVAFAPAGESEMGTKERGGSLERKKLSSGTKEEAVDLKKAKVEWEPKEEAV
jgi:hypothetical protein